MLPKADMVPKEIHHEAGWSPLLTNYTLYASDNRWGATFSCLNIVSFLMAASILIN